MVFSSSIFLYAFLPAFLLLYFLTPRFLRSLALAACSFVFYGWWKPEFVLLLLFSSVTDYWIGARIARCREQHRTRAARRWLTLSIVTNLGLLGYFKYANFGVASFKMLLQSLGFAGDFEWVEVVLPVGISFYTFQTMSYTVDLYRGEVQPSHNIVDFLCYVSMFPQLVAGPIVRYSVIEGELKSRQETWSKFYQGVLFFQCGLAKKVLLADAVAIIPDTIYGIPNATGLSCFDAWLGCVGYSFQIYFDFSGYSDMAIGLGLMLGFHFPINFDSPYLADSITDFWRRWHLSLSTWLRDYLYVPLGGGRRGTFHTYKNVTITMLLGGLWHGASWHMFFWGAYQSFWLVAERLMGKKPWYALAPRLVRVPLAYVTFLFSWPLFRGDSLPHAGNYLLSMVGAGGDVQPVPWTPFPWIEFGICAFIVWTLPTSQRLIPRARLWFVVFLQLVFLFAALHIGRDPDDIPFLYFRF